MIQPNVPIQVHSTNQKAWLLLNDTTNSKVLATLFKYHPLAKITWIYETTLLHEVKEQGPVLLEVTGTELYKQYQQNPNKWNGLLIYSQAEPQELLKHLRALLVVCFYGEEKGALNYFDLKVACFFFNIPNDQLGYWLGPIDNLYWWGGDFIAEELNSQKLHRVTNPLPVEQRIELPLEPTLTTTQEIQLELCQTQLDIKNFAVLNNILFLEAWQYYLEAQRLAFSYSNTMAYIKLKAKYPEKALPLDVLDNNLTSEQKLSHIKNHWKGQLITDTIN